MNVSKCPKCATTIFQIESITPHGTDRNIICVICHNCNTVVGSLDYLSVSEEHKKTRLQLDAVNKKLDTINNNIGQLMNGLKLVYSKLDKGNLKKEE